MAEKRNGVYRRKTCRRLRQKLRAWSWWILGRASHLLGQWASLSPRPSEDPKWATSYSSPNPNPSETCLRVCFRVLWSLRERDEVVVVVVVVVLCCVGTFERRTQTWKVLLRINSVSVQLGPVSELLNRSGMSCGSDWRYPIRSYDPTSLIILGFFCTYSPSIYRVSILSFFFFWH